MTVLDYRSGLDEWADPVRGRTGNWFSWAIYLGMSWTWCIGMYLPVLLVRDFGVWGWVVFAIPNVVGAAAMGWVLKDHDSQAMVQAHGYAIKAFSFVTAAFQLFFAFWMYDMMNADLAAAATVIFALIVLRASRREQNAQNIAAVVLMGSLATMLVEGMQGVLHLPDSVLMSGSVVLNLFALAPVCLFGFFLCPYLDATFHHARQRMPEHHARAAFSVGFSFFFLLMIVYSLLYARLFISSAGAQQRAGVIGHWIIQLGLTTGFHWYGAPREGERENRAIKRLIIVFSILAAVLTALLAAMDTPWLDGERIYRCFIGFYGLLFPAYVWLCMIPGKGRRVPTRRQWIVLGIAVLVALPMFWAGFVLGKMLWLLPGLTVVLLARIWIPKPPPEVEPL
jgi:hypothetical protein